MDHEYENSFSVFLVILSTRHFPEHHVQSIFFFILEEMIWRAAGPDVITVLEQNQKQLLSLVITGEPVIFAARRVARYNLKPSHLRTMTGDCRKRIAPPTEIGVAVKHPL